MFLSRQLLHIDKYINRSFNCIEYLFDYHVWNTVIDMQRYVTGMLSRRI